jgi:hypothetical protein
MFIAKCALRREQLPLLPCECSRCDWYIYDDTYSCCFWVLACILDITSGNTLSFEEIARLEGISLQETLTIYERAVSKLRDTSITIAKNNDFTDES